MKKTIKTFTLGFLLVLAAILFASCGYEPVFYGIMHDVAPEEATVNGNITSIVRCQINSEEYLVLSNGGSVAYKPLSASKHGEWKTDNIKLPFITHHYNYFPTSTEPEGHIGQQILRVIADQNNIYLLTATFKQDNDYGIVLPDTIYFWTCPINSLLSNSAEAWTNIIETCEAFPAVTFDSSNWQMNIGVFFTNTPKPEHRKAFISVTDPESKEVSYYKLNGSSAPEAEACSNYVQIYDKSKKINSAFYIGDTLYFTDSIAVATNETINTNATLVCIGGVNKNSNKNFDVFYYQGSDAPVSFIELGSPVASLVFTADSIIIGKGSYTASYTSNGGIDRVLLDENGMPQTTVADFDNNAKYQFTSSYIIMALLNADPSQKEADSDLYAAISYRGSGSSSSASFNNIGLWSYYPARGNWNRE